MVLVDTAAWVDFFRSGDDRLSALLSNGQVVSHPYVIGELALGHLSNRNEILMLLRELPSCGGDVELDFEQFVLENELIGKGVGFVDCSLLMACIEAGCQIWTVDKRLKKVAKQLGVLL